MTTHKKALQQTLKEAIQMEAGALLSFSAEMPHSMTDAIELVNARTPTRLVCTGMGKSGHIASKICATLISTGTPSQFLHPAEATHGDLGMLLSNDVILALSNSGETEEILRLIPFFKENAIPVISIVGNDSSTLARFSDICISFKIEREACPHNLAPTSSTTLSLAIGDALAIGLMQNRSFSPIDFARFHPGGSLGKKLLGRVGDYLAPCPIIKHDDPITNVVKDMISVKAMLGAVCSDGKVIGAITLGDIVRMISSANEANSSFLKQIASNCMNTNPVVVPISTNCSEAEQVMVKFRVNALIVVNEDGVPVGAYSYSSQG